MRSNELILTPGDLVMLDESTSYILRLDDLATAPALAELPESAQRELRDLAEGVVQSILNFPADVEGHRYIARARWRECFLIERALRGIQLARSPATLLSVELDGESVPPADVVIHRARGVIELRRGFWPAGGELIAEYYGGWRTPMQIDQGVGDLAGEGETAPALPAEIKHACLRAAHVAWSSYARRDVGVRTWREADADVGEFGVTYAPPPTVGGVDAEVFRLLAPWRRLMVA